MEQYNQSLVSDFYGYCLQKFGVFGVLRDEFIDLAARQYFRRILVRLPTDYELTSLVYAFKTLQ